MLINNDIYLNIELNRTLFDNVKNKSFSYFTKYISLRVKNIDDIKKIKTDVIQVNLSAIT